jgi:hypothetical protein
MGSIEPRSPVEVDAPCEGGTRGRGRWGFGELACYVERGAAKLRWTDDRTQMYGVLDATDGDVAALYQWWRSQGRRLGR